MSNAGSLLGLQRDVNLSNWYDPRGARASKQTDKVKDPPESQPSALTLILHSAMDLNLTSANLTFTLYEKLWLFNSCWMTAWIYCMLTSNLFADFTFHLLYGYFCAEPLSPQTVLELTEDLILVCGTVSLWFHREHAVYNHNYIHSHTFTMQTKKTTTVVSGRGISVNLNRLLFFCTKIGS